MSETSLQAYDKAGNVRTVKDKRGIVSETIYDDLYRVKEKWRAEVRLVSNEYDAAGNLVAAVDAENRRTEYAYNSRNLLERTTYLGGENDDTTERFYDGAGNVVSAFDEARKETVSTYDKENRLKAVTFAGETTENFYDPVGNLAAVARPKGNRRAMAYDGLGRLTSVTDGGLLTTRYEYDANGNLRTQTDPRGNVVEFTYDELNRRKEHLQRKSSGDLTVRYDAYDAEGNLKQMTDAMGRVFRYEYDELNRQTKTIYPPVATPFLTLQEVTTTFDANNNVETITETKQASGGGTITDTTVNVWDDFDRLDASTQRGRTIDYGYDRNGNRTRVATVNGATAYTYDHRNRLQKAIVGADETVYAYTPAGRTDTVTYPNGTSATYTYWPTSRVETITHRAGETEISRYAYEYDANGNRTQQVEVQGTGSQGVPVPLVTDYAYDTLDRLKSFTLTSGAEITVTGYTFDGYNRRTETVTENGRITVRKTYDYDETDWLTQVVDRADSSNPVTIAYHYDANGNTVRKTVGTGSGTVPVPDEPTVTTFTYDAANRLVQTMQGATLLGQYDYNAQGMRTRHYGSERGDVEYYYDDGAVLEEYVAGANGGLLAHYRYGDRLLSLQAGSETHYYHHDALGSTVNLTGAAGAVKVRYILDPWGQIRNQVGESVNRQIFTGQEHDEQTGLIYFGARYYDPDSARFITQDSYLGEPGTPPSLHRYLYAYSNPTVYVDLNGYKSLDFLTSPLKRFGEFINNKIDDLSNSKYRNEYTEPFFRDAAVVMKRGQAGVDLLHGTASAADFVLDAGIARLGQIGRMAGVDTTFTQPYEQRVKGTVTNAVEAGKAVAQIALIKEKRDAAIEYGKGVLKTETEKYAQGDLNTRAGVQVGIESAIASVATGGASQMTKLRTLPKIADDIVQGAKSIDKSQSLMQKAKTLYQNSRLADEIGGVGDISSVKTKTSGTILNGEMPDPYTGVKAASQYLKDNGVSRGDRVRILQSFEAENMAVRQADQAEFGLRYFSDPKRAGGSYLFETFPASRGTLAIKPTWSTMSGFRQFQIRPGATVLEGRASTQGPYLPGGQIQKFLLDWRSDLIQP